MTLQQRRGQPLLALQGGKAVTSFIAHPVAVYARILARLEAVDAIAMMVDVDRAATLAHVADRRRSMQIPYARAEAKFLLRQSADRTDVDDVACIFVIDLVSRYVFDPVA